MEEVSNCADVTSLFIGAQALRKCSHVGGCSQLIIWIQLHFYTDVWIWVLSEQRSKGPLRKYTWHFVHSQLSLTHLMLFVSSQDGIFILSVYHHLAATLYTSRVCEAFTRYSTTHERWPVFATYVHLRVAELFLESRDGTWRKSSCSSPYSNSSPNSAKRTKKGSTWCHKWCVELYLQTQPTPPGTYLTRYTVSRRKMTGVCITRVLTLMSHRIKVDCYSWGWLFISMLQCLHHCSKVREQ